MMKKIYDNTYAVRDSVPKTESVTLVGGSFDLLHVGHLHLLEYAKKQGDVLVVTILSDNMVRSYKSANRPIVPQHYRARMVAALSCVDRVYISDINTSDKRTLSAINPSNVVFGREDTDHWIEVAKKREEFFRSNFPDIQINYLERFHDKMISTTGLIKKIISSCDN